MFDAASSSDLRPLIQHPSILPALRLTGQQPILLGGTVILHRRFAGIRFAMVPRAAPAVLAGLPEQIRAAGLHRIPLLLSPEAPCTELADTGALPLMTPAAVAELDLTPPFSERRSQLKQKWRNRLYRAEESNLRITHGRMPADPDHWLLKADEAQATARGYRGWPVRLSAAYATTNPGDCIVFTALDDDAPVAAMLFLRHGRVATYHVGHTTEAGRRLNAHNLLLWRAADWFSRQGCHRLDLGTLEPARAPGLARFKLGTGAQTRVLGGTWLWWPPLGRSLAPFARLDRHVMAPRAT